MIFEHADGATMCKSVDILPYLLNLLVWWPQQVEDGKIQRMEVLPVKGAGPLALYKALGGKI